MTLSIKEYDWLGFDMDHTLVKYRRKEFYLLLHEAFSKYLVEELGYNEKILERKFFHFFTPNFLERWVNEMSVLLLLHDTNAL